MMLRIILLSVTISSIFSLPLQQNISQLDTIKTNIEKREVPKQKDLLVEQINTGKFNETAVLLGRGFSGISNLTNIDPTIAEDIIKSITNGLTTYYKNQLIEDYGPEQRTNDDENINDDKEEEVKNDNNKDLITLNKTPDDLVTEINTGNFDKKTTLLTETSRNTNLENINLKIPADVSSTDEDLTIYYKNLLTEEALIQSNNEKAKKITRDTKEKIDHDNISADSKFQTIANKSSDLVTQINTGKFNETTILLAGGTTGVTNLTNIDSKIPADIASSITEGLTIYYKNQLMNDAQINTKEDKTEKTNKYSISSDLKLHKNNANKSSDLVTQINTGKFDDSTVLTAGGTSGITNLTNIDPIILKELTASVLEGLKKYYVNQLTDEDTTHNEEDTKKEEEAKKEEEGNAKEEETNCNNKDGLKCVNNSEELDGEFNKTAILSAGGITNSTNIDPEIAEDIIESIKKGLVIYYKNYFDDSIMKSDNKTDDKKEEIKCENSTDKCKNQDDLVHQINKGKINEKNIIIPGIFTGVTNFTEIDPKITKEISDAIFSGLTTYYKNQLLDDTTENMNDFIDKPKDDKKEEIDYDNAKFKNNSQSDSIDKPKEDKKEEAICDNTECKNKSHGDLVEQINNGEFNTDKILLAGGTSGIANLTNIDPEIAKDISSYILQGITEYYKNQLTADINLRANK